MDEVVVDKVRKNLKFSKVETNFFRKFLRSFRAYLSYINGRLAPLRPWLKIFLLIIAAGFLVISIEMFGWTVNIATILSGILTCGVTISLISFLVGILDDITRDHVGGRKNSISEESLTLPEEYSVEIVEANTPAFDTTIEFADQFYMGTMEAGKGVDKDKRIQKRRQIWVRHISQSSNALCVALSEDELAALTLVYPIDNDTLGLAEQGRMHYPDIGKNQIAVSQDDIDKGFGIYISVSLGEAKHLKDLQASGKDLVGGLLVHHISEILISRNLPYDKATLITDGFKGFALRSFLRKGFTELPQKNPFGYPILKLDMKKNYSTPFVRAICNRLGN